MNAWMVIISLVVVGLLALFGLAVVRLMFTDGIKLNNLVSEKDGNASLSRFQMLLFTFVIAGSYLMLVLYKLVNADMDMDAEQLKAIAAVAQDKPLHDALVQAASERMKEGFTMPTIPEGVLVLLGISGGSYVLSKGIQTRKKTAEEKEAEEKRMEEKVAAAVQKALAEKGIQ